MKRVASLLAAGMLVGSSFALDFDFQGTFNRDNEVVKFDFLVGETSDITIFSSSWDDGGFDPILAIWDASGQLVYEQDDGGNSGSTYSNGVLYTHGNWDSYFNASLSAGQYTASITQFDNFALGSNLADGFSYDGNENFTYDNGYGAQPYFNGVLGSPNDPRTGSWVFHILNVNQARQHDVPEPTMLSMFGCALFGLVALARRKK